MLLTLLPLDSQFSVLMGDNCRRSVTYKSGHKVTGPQGDQVQIPADVIQEDVL